MAALTLPELLPVILLLLLLCALGLVVVYAHWSGKRGTVAAGEAAAAAPAAAPAARAPRAAPRRRGGLARMRRAAAANAAPAVADEGASGDDGEAAGDGMAAGDGAGPARAGRVGKKKAANREAKREARESREAALQALREEREQADELRAEAREAAAEEAAAAAAAAEAARAEKEEKERAEYEEWRGLISVEGAGEGADEDAQEDPELLAKFCAFVRDTKVVALEELAAEFELRTEDAIDRLKRLEEAGTISGFFDDRGKFVHVSESEMRDVARFIEKRGRVSIQELAVESTRLLGLDRPPKAQGAVHDAEAITA